MKELDSLLSNSQLNNSTAKMKYSFPKSQRFDKKQHSSCSPDKFYDLPQIKNKRSAGIGYANKIDLTKRNFKVPAPNSYKLNSSFELRKNQGISIAEGRDKVKANDMFKVNFKVPSPFDYNPESNPTKVSYTIAARIQDKSDKWIRSVPGPGSYSAVDITAKEDSVPLSKFIASPSTRFGRMKRITQAEIKNKKTPGPGQYNNDSLISKPYKSKVSSKFPIAQRPSIAKTNNVPGPGSYSHISEFN